MDEAIRSPLGHDASAIETEIHRVVQSPRDSGTGVAIERSSTF
jgi:hypothetical protein